MHSSIEELVAAYPACCEKNRVAVENKRRFEIDYKEDFTLIRIDGCLIDSQLIEKCDFGFSRKSNGDFYFVELKGEGIKKAYSQLINTIKYFENNLLKIPKNKRYGFIVSSRSPLSSQDIRNLKQDFAKKYGQLLDVQNMVLKHPRKK